MVMEGKKVVITTDRSLFTTYRENPWFFGLASAFPTNWMPRFIQHKFYCKAPEPNYDGTAKSATLALRCVESSFIQNGIPKEDIVVAHPNNLYKFIGKRTEFVCISAQDPLGIGPVTTTWRSLAGSDSFNQEEFRRLMINDLSQYRKKYNFKIVVGGPGSWQLSSKEQLDLFKIDYLTIGEVETLIPKIISLPNQKIIKTPPAKADEVPPILGSTMDGLIEITRGCGLGCSFCGPTLSGKLRSFPLEKVVADATLNVRMRQNGTIHMHSDNTLNYGSKTLLPDEDVIMNLYKSLFAIDQIKRVYLTFNNLSTIAYLPDFIKKLTKFLKNKGHKYYYCQTGIETASSRLMKKHMPNKCNPYTPEEWPDVVERAIKVLKENKWIVVPTIIIGLPGEQKEDLLQTLKLITTLEDCKNVFLSPIFFDPIATTKLGSWEGLNVEKLTQLQWSLFAQCWKHNIKNGWNLYRMVSSEFHRLKSKILPRIAIQFAKVIIPLKIRRKV